MVPTSIPWTIRWLLSVRNALRCRPMQQASKSSRYSRHYSISPQPEHAKTSFSWYFRCNGGQNKRNISSYGVKSGSCIDLNRIQLLHNFGLVKLSIVDVTESPRLQYCNSPSNTQGAGVETCINNTSFPPAILHQRPNQYSKKRYLHFRAATRTITSPTQP